MISFSDSSAERAPSRRRDQSVQYMLPKTKFVKKTKKPKKVVADVKKAVKIRSNFPETWLWSDESIK